jgi:ribose 5-phosphate isomerase A
MAKDLIDNDLRKSDLEKESAARASLRFVRDGNIVGLGTGSTAAYAVRFLGERVQAGLKIRGIPTSVQTKELAASLGIPLTTLNEFQQIDVTIDGADEFDPQLSLIKGGGGALLREKILAQASAREVIVVDGGKLVERLGATRPVPVEVALFGWRAQALFLESLGARVALRENPDRSPFLTEQGNMILDARFEAIDDPRALAAELERRAGIVEHGLFLGLADEVIVAEATGLRTLTAGRRSS